MTFSIVRQKAGLRETARDALLRLIESQADTPVLFLSSGGSALSLLDFSVPSNVITVGLVDERHGVAESDRNSVALRETELAKSAVKKGVSIICFDHEVPLGVAALNYEAALRALKKRYPDGAVIITLGMGADGHTCGVFPFPKAPDTFNTIFGGSSWVAGYDTAKNEFRSRLTVTPHFLKNEVYAAVALVSGESKKSALENVLAHRGSVAETPARLITEIRYVEMFSDIL